MVTGEGEDARSSVSLYRLPLERWPVDSQNHSGHEKGALSREKPFKNRV